MIFNYIVIAVILHKCSHSVNSNTHLINYKQLVFSVHLGVWQTEESLSYYGTITDNSLICSTAQRSLNKYFGEMTIHDGPMFLTCFCMRHHGPQVLHQVSCSKVDASGGENENSFLVGPFTLFKESLCYSFKMNSNNIALKMIWPWTSYLGRKWPVWFEFCVCWQYIYHRCWTKLRS